MEDDVDKDVDENEDDEYGLLSRRESNLGAVLSRDRLRSRVGTEGIVLAIGPVVAEPPLSFIQAGVHDLQMIRKKNRCR